MKRNNGEHSLMITGAPSIIMIFVVLCLICFATLSMVSANADLRLAQKTAENVAAYYRADAAAQTRVAELSGAEASGLDPAQYAVEATGGQTYVTFYTAITPSTALQTTVLLTGSAPEIVVNRTVITAELSYTELPDIWNGEDIHD